VRLGEGSNRRPLRASEGGVPSGKAAEPLETLDTIDARCADREDGFESQSCDQRHRNAVRGREAGGRKE
jgi:hypothetical protein